MEKKYYKKLEPVTDLPKAIDLLKDPDNDIVAIRRNFHTVTADDINTAKFTEEEVMSRAWEVLVEDKERSEKLNKLREMIEDANIRTYFNEWSYSKLCNMDIHDIFHTLMERINCDDDKRIEIIRFIIEKGLYKNKK